MTNHFGPFTPAGRLGNYVAINEHALPIMAPLFDNDGDGGGGGGGGTPTVEQLQAELTKWQTEAKKAFGDRDGLKSKLRDLEGKVLSDEDRELFSTLKTQQEQLEEEKKKKAGEFDAWRTQIADKHGKELQARDQKLAEQEGQTKQAVKDLHDTLIGLAFAGASEYFGDNGKTVLTPDIAQSHFGKFVEVQTDDNGRRTVVVKDASGSPILDTKTGRPMPFEKAIGELIEALPSKDRILRGSGKAGSGNGGGGKATPVDFATLAKKAAAGDQEAAKALRAQRPSTGIVMGEAYS
jgi:hypothetical protein